MIKFFRKIRQKLLTENKFSKYLIYAIGEIILVVLGILIALQVNNWNEERKLNKLEIATLNEIKISLEQSALDLENLIKHNERSYQSCSILLDAFDSGRPYNDSLNIHLNKFDSRLTPYFDYAAYETLKFKGIDLISNETLRKSIVQMFEKIMNILLSTISRAGEFNSNIYKPFITFNTSFDPSTRYDEIHVIKPNDYIEFHKNLNYRSLMTHIMHLRWDERRSAKLVKSEIEDLIISITKEMEK
jgi:hypothetical protein